MIILTQEEVEFVRGTIRRVCYNFVGLSLTPQTMEEYKGALQMTLNDLLRMGLLTEEQADVRAYDIWIDTSRRAICVKPFDLALISLYD